MQTLAPSPALMAPASSFPRGRQSTPPVTPILGSGTAMDLGRRYPPKSWEA